MSESRRRQELAYWLTLGFQLKGERTRMKNGLVLEADRRERLSLLDVVELEPEALPERLRPFAALHERLRDAAGRASAQAFLVQQLVESDVTVVPVTDDRYPRHLARALTPERTPTVLFVKGDPGLLEQAGVAVSGSRKAGKQGLAFARAMGAALAAQGVTLVSGLAAGVDQAALEGALEAGGRVVGVAPEGLLRCALLHRPEITEGRLTLVSEFAPTLRWAQWAAMKRNHTIAGLSRALVIADCVKPGGTTEQLEVHRRLGFPVFLRRGAGEGPLVAELARRPGVSEIAWDGGEVHAPGLLDEGSTDIACAVERNGERVHVRIDANANAPVEDIVAAVRDHWPDRVEEAPAAPYEASVDETAATDDESDDPVVTQLRDAGETTVKELSRTLGFSESRVRKRLRSLEEAGLVSRDREVRPHRWSWRARRPPEKHTDAASRQLGLFERRA